MAARYQTARRKRYETIRLVADRFWRAFFGKQRLSEIESSDIRRYLAHRGQGTVPGAKTLKAISPSTLNNDRGLPSTLVKASAERPP